MIDQSDIIRGYVHSDGYSDTHGFRMRPGMRAICNFYGPDVEMGLPRAIWVDHLGDYYVLSEELDHFVRLDGSECSYRIEEG